MPRYVAKELYEKYKHRILEMSPAIQYYEGTEMQRGRGCLSDGEIAERLGLDIEDVTEICCIAEVDLIPKTTWIESDNWKKSKVASE